MSRKGISKYDIGFTNINMDNKIFTVIEWVDKDHFKIKFEESGLSSPVVSVSGRYLSGCKFADTVLIYVKVSSVKGARFTLKYEMVREEGGEKVFEGESVHCFKNPDGIPLRLERDLPGFYAELIRQMEK